ncbi:hypothetical protein FOZ61_001618, partial [Perkinsus olseni]
AEIRLNFPAGGANSGKTAKFPLRCGENTLWVEAYVVDDLKPSVSGFGNGTLPGEKRLDEAARGYSVLEGSSGVWEGKPFSVLSVKDRNLFGDRSRVRVVGVTLEALAGQRRGVRGSFAETPMTAQEGNPVMTFSAEELNELKGFRCLQDGPLGCAKGIKFRVDTTTESPVFSRPYRMNPIAAKNTNKLVKELLDEGVIEETTSPWASPAFVVPKRDGSGRLVVDYRKWNKITVPDRYRSPTIEEILGGVSEGAHFSVIDLRKGFHQVEVEEASQGKLAFMIGNKQYTFRRMAMGPRNAPACFQRAVDAAFGTLLAQCCFVYLDDIIIYTPKGKGKAGHLADVKRTLRGFGPSRVHYSLG